MDITLFMSYILFVLVTGKSYINFLLFYEGN